MKRFSEQCAWVMLLMVLIAVYEIFNSIKLIWLTSSTYPSARIKFSNLLSAPVRIDDDQRRTAALIISEECSPSAEKFHFVSICVYSYVALLWTIRVLEKALLARFSCVTCGADNNNTYVYIVRIECLSYAIVDAVPKWRTLDSGWGKRYDIYIYEIYYWIGLMHFWIEQKTGSVMK